MAVEELLDDNEIPQLIRTPVLKVLEAALILGHLLVLVVAIAHLPFENFILENIMEEALLMFLSLLSIYYLYCWRKASLAYDQKQTSLLLQSRKLKLFYYLSFFIGLFFFLISIIEPIEKGISWNGEAILELLPALLFMAESVLLYWKTASSNLPRITKRIRRIRAVCYWVNGRKRFSKPGSTWIRVYPRSY